MAVNYQDYKVTKHTGLFIHQDDSYKFWFVATIVNGGVKIGSIESC